MRQELIKLVATIEERPIGSVYAVVTFYGLGGAVKDKGKYETAFYYRDSNYIISIQLMWESPFYARENKEWVSNKLKYLEMITTGYYVNFPYSSLMNYEKKYYGGNLYRLRYVKSKYDPFNIFNYPQSISAEVIKL